MRRGVEGSRVGTRLATRLTGWGVDLVDLLLPAGCVACRAWIPGGRAAPLVCAVCRSRLREAPWPRCPRCHHPRGSRRPLVDRCSECAGWNEALTAARHAVVLGTPAEDLVHSLKYEGWSELAVPMGEAMARALTGAAEGELRLAVVVPVPTTPDRVRSRGYNQAELLARRVASLLELPLAGALERARARRSQTGLSPLERADNVRSAFRAVDAERVVVRGADVLLVDDVLTTGATASEAASALSEMGARSVTLLTYARALATAPEGAR